MIGGIKEMRSDHGKPRGMRNPPLPENRQGITGRAQRIQKYRTVGTIMQVGKRIRKKETKRRKGKRDQACRTDKKETS